MKELKIMKALRYILLVVSMLSFLNTNAQVSTQDWGKQPEAQMHSTSVMQGSGSTLPSAAVQGVSTISDQPTTSHAAYGPRKDPRPSDWSDPYKDPIGDALLPLALMACVYLIVRARRKRKSAMSK